MSKKTAFGVRLLITDPETGDVLHVPFVGDITGPDVTRAAIDVTNHDSPDGFSEFLSGIGEGGDVQFECFFDPSHTVHERLAELADLGLPCDMALLLPTVSTGEFLANPFFAGWDGTEMPDWVISAGSGWSGSDGYIDYLSSNPQADEDLSAALSSSLLAGETYTFAFKFLFEDATDFDLQVKLGSTVIGTVNPSNQGTQKINYAPTEDLTADLILHVPESIGSQVGFTFGSVSVTGPTANDTERWNFTGLVTAFGNTMPVKDAIKAPVSIKVSGKPSFVTSAT